MQAAGLRHDVGGHDTTERCRTWTRCVVVIRGSPRTFGPGAAGGPIEGEVWWHRPGRARAPARNTKARDFGFDARQTGCPQAGFCAIDNASTDTTSFSTAQRSASSPPLRQIPMSRAYGRTIDAPKTPISRYDDDERKMQRVHGRQSLPRDSAPSSRCRLAISSTSECATWHVCKRRDRFADFAADQPWRNGGLYGNNGRLNERGSGKAFHPPPLS